MPTEYRLMRPEEEPAVLTLWSDVFDVSYAYEQARFASDPHAHEHTYVAVAPDGTMLSTVHSLISLRRDATGMPRRVGEIDPVATRPEARRQGHAGRLLKLTLDALRHEGCDWSLLVASEEGRPLYERYGWRSFPERWRQGTVLGEQRPVSHMYNIQPFDPLADPQGWARLSVVEHAYNAVRPLTVVRDAHYWQRFAAVRINHWITAGGLVIFVARRFADDQDLCGYIMANFYDMGFLVRELAVLPDAPDVIPELLWAVVHEAIQRGCPLAGRVYLPHETDVDTALAALFQETLHSGFDEGRLMARTVQSTFTDDQLALTFAAPNAMYSYIDHF